MLLDIITQTLPNAKKPTVYGEEILSKNTPIDKDPLELYTV